MKPTDAQFGNYQKVFDYFNQEVFNNELPNIMLNFSRKNKRVGGFFAPSRWEGIDIETGEMITTHEISLNPEGYTKDTKVLLSIFVHEMVHLWQEEFGAPSRGGYHNKEWGDKMENIGLMPSNTGEPGGRRTGQQMTHYIIEGGMFDIAYSKIPEEILLPFLHLETPPKTKKSKQKTKYVCSCGIKVWGKDGLSITCNECGEILEAE